MAISVNKPVGAGLEAEILSLEVGTAAWTGGVGANELNAWRSWEKNSVDGGS